MSLVGRKIRVLDEIKNYTEDLATVVYDGETQLGLEFSKDYDLHSCNDNGTNKRCWYINKTPAHYRLLDSDARFDKGNEEIFNKLADSEEYNGFKTTTNGKLIKVTHNSNSILIISNEKILASKLTTQEEKVYANHVLSFYNILEGKGFNNTFILEVVPPKVEEPVVVVETTVTIPEMQIPKKAYKKPKVAPKIYETEEELLAELGIK